jgi:hypothetical protein
VISRALDGRLGPRAYRLMNGIVMPFYRTVRAVKRDERHHSSPLVPAELR